MPFTYSGNPKESQLDELRFTIQDTDSSDWLLSDEEIEYLISIHKSTLQSASAACSILIAKFSRLVDEQTGKQTIYASQMYQHYVSLKSQLDRDIALSKTNLFFGGTSIPKQFDDHDGDNWRVWRELKN